MNAARRPGRAFRAAWRISGVGDFGAADRDLAQGGVDVGGFDVGCSGTSGCEPGGLGEEVEGSRVSFAGLGEEIDGGGGEDLAVESGEGDVPVEVGSDVLAGQGMELVGGADPAEDGALDGEAQAAEQVVVTEQDEGERAAGAASEAQEHAEFLQGCGGVVLRVVEDEHEGHGLDVGEVFFEREQVGAAFEPGTFAEFGQKDFEHAGGRERGLGDEQRQVALGFEPSHPGFEQRAFPGAGGTGEH